MDKFAYYDEDKEKLLRVFGGRFVDKDPKAKGLAPASIRVAVVETGQEVYVRFDYPVTSGDLSLTPECWIETTRDDVAWFLDKEMDSGVFKEAG